MDTLGGVCMVVMAMVCGWGGALILSFMATETINTRMIRMTGTTASTAHDTGGGGRRKEEGRGREEEGGGGRREGGREGEGGGGRRGGQCGRGKGVREGRMDEGKGRGGGGYWKTASTHLNKPTWYLAHTNYRIT